MDIAAAISYTGKDIAAPKIVISYQSAQVAHCGTVLYKYIRARHARMPGPPLLVADGRLLGLFEVISRKFAHEAAVPFLPSEKSQALCWRRL